MHKSSQEDPIAVSGISPHVSSNNSWINDKNGYIMPKDKAPSSEDVLFKYNTTKFNRYFI